MGRGNSVIRNENNDKAKSTYFIEYNNEDEYDWNDILEEIKLPLKEYSDNTYYSDTFRNNYIRVLQTNVMEVIVSDDDWAMAIGCIPIMTENDKPKNLLAFKKQANKLMTRLHKLYSLGVSCGAWTSGRVVENETNFY